MTNEIIVTKHSIDQLIEFEVTSERHYNEFLTRPYLPNLNSGITIGIGYDLGFHTPEQIKDDWSDLPSKSVYKLMSVAGLTAQAAKSLLMSTQEISVSFDLATKVFENKTLQITAKALTITYPEVEQLRPSAVGALLSLTYNRGFKLTGTRRLEMFNIRQLVLNKDYFGISNQILMMKKYWDGSMRDIVPGLVARRTREAALVLMTNDYKPEELLAITF